MQLTNQLRGKTLIVNKLNFRDPHILHKLNNIGISKGSSIKVLDYQDSKKVVHISVFGVEYVLREKDCLNIDVSL